MEMHFAILENYYYLVLNRRTGKMVRNIKHTHTQKKKKQPKKSLGSGKLSTYSIYEGFGVLQN